MSDLRKDAPEADGSEATGTDPVDTATTPLTRRELRERERAAEKLAGSRAATDTVSPATVSPATVSPVTVSTVDTAPVVPAPVAPRQVVAASVEPAQVDTTPVVSGPAIAATVVTEETVSDADLGITPSGVPEGILPVVDLPAPVVHRVSASTATSSASPAAANASDRIRRSTASTRVRKVRAAKPAVATTLRTRASSRLLSLGALLFAGAMVVGLSVPASAFFVNTPTALMAENVPAAEEGQVVEADGVASATTVEYDSWGVASSAELQQASTIRTDASYSVDNSGDVQWPFPVAVPISDGYGTRVSPCSGCSTQHKGTDFTPGVGTAITAIADGVVTIKATSSWGFGYHVYIEHVVDGQKVTSLYAHMQAGSSELEVGDVVSAGDFVGLVGQTGAATGPHLHLEIHIDDVPVDPYLWLTAHAS